MKLFSVLFGIFLAFLTMPLVHAQDEMPPNSAACQLAWSRGFDAVKRHMVENTTYGMGVFLNQNDIAPTDMWSAYRSVSAANKCFLEAVCSSVHRQGRIEMMDTPLAPENMSGGAIPGIFSVCPVGVTIEEMLRTVSATGVFEPEELSACDFSQTTFVTEPMEIQHVMYQNCRNHAELETAVFDRVLRNMIMDDINRKTYGYISAQILSFIDRLKSLQDSTNQFVNNFNASIAGLCTLSNPD